MLRFNNKMIEEAKKLFGPPVLIKESGVAKANEYRNKVDRFLQDKIFDASPEEARIYHSESSALQSIGRWRRSKEERRAYGKYVLPDHLEIHEVKETFMCIMRPDGSSNCDDENAK